MPYVLTCSLCGRGTDVEHFEVSLRINRVKFAMRVGAGGLDLCSVCWTKYASPTALGVENWNGLMSRKAKALAARQATDLPEPIRRISRSSPNA